MKTACRLALLVPLLWTPARVLAQCAGIVSTPRAAADCTAASTAPQPDRSIFLLNQPLVQM